MHIQTLTRSRRAALIPALFVSTNLILSGCSEVAAPVGKPGAAPETPSKPGSDYKQDMQKAAAKRPKR
jgi:hypothetical protein